jgi:transposase InsO family protein
VDKLTKYTHFIPCSTDISAKGLAHVYKDRIFPLHGIPKKVISDRGPQFVSSFMVELCKQLRIEQNPSTAYHPQTDGQSEIRNAHLKTYLRKWVNLNQDDWTDFVGMAQLAINNTVNRHTGFSPFMLNHGRDPRVGIHA